MVFPVAIFQKLYFDEKDIAISYGAVGSIIGHEITHVFDDNGNLNNWWNDADKKKFKYKTAKIIKQFSKYKLYGKNINGELTQWENIADLRGCTITFHAFQKY